MNTASTQSDPLPGKTDVELSLGQRQIAALGFVAILLLSCVATMAYVAGRSVGPAKSGSRAAATAPQLVSSPAPRVETAKVAATSRTEQLIVVEPASAQAPSIMALRAAEPLLPAPMAAQVPAPSVHTKTPDLEPLSPHLLVGNTFWQVAATDKGMSEVTCELLTRKGLPAVIGDSPSPGVYRVLVGPIHAPAEMTRFKAALDEAGFHPFVKKY